MAQSEALLRSDEFDDISDSKSSFDEDEDEMRAQTPVLDLEALREQAAHRSARVWQYSVISSVLIALIVIFGIAFALETAVFPVQPASKSMGECGRTPEQARQRGCVFDLMMSGWVHPPCYDQELSDRFLRENNFAFFWDREGTKQLTEAEARLGNYKTIFTNGTFHYQHCTYIWAKQISARRKNPFVLDSQSRSVEHVEHCFRRVGSPNVTQIQLQTGTKLHSSTWRLDCIIGEREVHTEH